MESNSIFLKKMEELVKQVVTFYNIPCYLVDSKIETHANAYGEHVRIPVVRVVSFFEDSISSVSNLLNQEFDLQTIKDISDNVDTFSSSGVTYQAGLKGNRMELPEYKILTPHKFEIRVSSILQDVYTAMQKTLSNGSATVPSNVKRDFYRVGSFLEMADIEFVKIRNNAAGNGANATMPGAMPAVAAAIPQINRTTQVVTPVPEPVVMAAPPPPPPAPAQAAPPPPVAAVPVPEPTPVPEPALPPVDAFKVNRSEADKNNIESIDMSVDSSNSLDLNINNIEKRNGSGDDTYLDMIASGNKPANEDIMLPLGENSPFKTDLSGDKADGANSTAPDGVALNIDNVETFNMNVNGMIERTTEITKDGGDRNGHAPMDEVAAAKALEDLDENAQMTEEMLAEFVKNSKLVRDVDSNIAERAGAKINDELDIEGDVERLRFLKVFTIKQLTERIADNKDDIVAFAEKWIGKDNGGSFDSGICLFYLEYLLVGKKNDPAFAVEYVLKFISDNDYSARYIIPTYNSIRQTSEPTSFAHLTLK